MIEYLKKLEIAYPSKSYNDVKNQIEPFNVLEQPNLQERNENFICKEIVKILDPSPTSNRYAHMVLEWIKYWSLNSRDKVLADSLILNPELLSEISVDPNIIWSVLIEQNNLVKIREWIDRVDSKLYLKKVDQHMIDCIYESSQMPNSSKQILLNHLAK